MNSYWNENYKGKDFPKLNKNIEVDVCVIGGGIAGINTAYYLAGRGLKVAVLEKNKLCSSTTGGSTGKITSQHGLIYKYLKDLNGKEYATKYYKANEEAKENIIKIINKEKIDCDLEYKNAYVYTEVEKAIGHEYESVVVKEATCTTDGIVAHRHCNRCEKNFEYSSFVSMIDSKAISAAMFVSYTVYSASTPSSLMLLL